jgi:hypothetical protein
MGNGEANFLKAFDAKAASIAAELERVARMLRSGDVKAAAGRVASASTELKHMAGLLR